ncbi:MAG: EamA family transporter [Ruminococcaceae bacterium]|nr:EamA family transporter [Oscillospiraceae bacterium]
MWFFYALLSVFLWGGADLFYKLGSKVEIDYSHLWIVVNVGIVMGIHAFYQIVTTPVTYLPINIVKYLPVSLLYIGSMTIGYFGLRYIELSISSPLGNSSGAVAFLLLYIFMDEPLTALQIAAITTISLGIIALSALEKGKSEVPFNSQDKKYKYSAIAIIFPILYCIIDGVGTFADGIVLSGVMDEFQANISYELSFLFVGLISLIYLIAVKKQKLKLFEQRERAVAAVFETAGQFFYVKAMSGNAVVTAPLVASYSVVSVILSRLFLKEKLKISQYITIVFISVSIVILGME